MAWQTPKTDWMSKDYLNLEVDLNRIEGDILALAEVLQDQGIAVDLETPKTDWDKNDFLRLEDLVRVETNINTLISAYEAEEFIDMLPAFYRNNFGLKADKMNQIEQTLVYLQYVKEVIAQLIDRDELLICDNADFAVFCTATENNKVKYQSMYTGEEMDAFVNQIRSWNNGVL